MVLYWRHCIRVILYFSSHATILARSSSRKDVKTSARSTAAALLLSVQRVLLLPLMYLWVQGLYVWSLFGFSIFNVMLNPFSPWDWTVFR